MKTFILLFCLFASLASFAQNEILNIELTTTDGETTTLQQEVIKDGVSIVSLWATWCVPCLKELDAISEVWDEWQGKTNVELFAVSVDDSRTVKRVKPLINGKGWDYQFLLDTNNDLKRALGASTVPLTLLIKNNQIMYKHSGYTSGDEFELFEKIKEISE